MKKLVVAAAAFIACSVPVISGCSHATAPAVSAPPPTAQPVTAAANPANVHYPPGIAKQIQAIQAGNGSPALKQHAIQQFEMQFGHPGGAPGGAAK